MTMVRTDVCLASLLAFALVLGVCDCANSALCRSEYPGVYHLDCYKSSVTTKALLAARRNCFRLFYAIPGYFGTCYWAYDYGTASGSGSLTTPNYGCSTYLIEAAITQACMDAYLAHRAANCTEYQDLNDDSNQATPTVATAADCTGSGPCNPSSPGPYHLDCYGPSFANAHTDPLTVLGNAKKQCALDFYSSKAAARAKCKAEDWGAVIRSTPALYGCSAYITYTFGNQACLDLYRAQEDTNPNCTLYNEAGLGDAANLATPNALLQTEYTC